MKAELEPGQRQGKPADQRGSQPGMKPSSRQRGLGLVFRRGRIWWVQYNQRGERHRESSGSANRADAVKLLRRRIADVQAGKPVGTQIDKTTLDDLLAVLFDNYRMRGLRSLKRVTEAGRHLTRHLGGEARAATLAADRVTAYVVARQAEQAAPATINRELAALKRGFRLALKVGKVAVAPIIDMLPEHNARQGFVDHGEFLALLGALPPHLRDPIAFLYLSGWRRTEMARLEWRDVDWEGSVIRLRPELSKSKDGRVLPLAGELRAVVERACECRRLDCPLVFHSDGRPLGDFRNSWKRATTAAGLGRLLVHDLRRCAVRNLSRAGVPERIAMQLTGHKTRAVFDRYNIVSEADLKHAVARVGDYLQGQPATPRVVAIGGRGR